jgi:hypothetical protein
MRFRSRSHLAALGVLIAGAVACTEKSPVFDGDPFFPDGRPVTLEVLVPATQFLDLRGSFTGYSDASSVPYTVVANSFDGGVTARTLVRFPTAFPREIEFTSSGSTLRDSLYTVVSAELVLTVDSLASSGEVPLSLHHLTERWDDSIVSWTRRAADSLGTYDWTTPGGSFGPAFSTGRYRPADSAHVAILPIDSAQTRVMRDSTYPGLLVQATQANTRLHVDGAQLRVTINPSNVGGDSTFVVNFNASADALGLIYTPEAALPTGLLAAGTLRSARTLFSMDIPDSLNVCTPTCVRWATRDLALHQASLLLRPQPAAGGYRLLDSAVVSLRTIAEPELGQLAPLGEAVVASVSSNGRGVPAQGRYFATDTVVELPFTLHAARMISGDTVSSDFALLGSRTDALAFTPFSLLLFDAAPRLRIVFTVPERPGLP